MKREDINAVPAEADRCLRIWAEYKNRETGVVTLGFPKRSAGMESGGASTEDSFDELVGEADRRTGAISDAILDDMGRRGLNQQVLAIFNRYFADVFSMRGGRDELLIDGCVTFLIEARKKGIAT